MNILLVGNGFDLAHGLPTRYTDFLNFLRAVQFRNSTEYLGINDNEKIAKTGVHDEIKALLKEPINMHKWNIDEVYRLMNKNVWVEYFLAVYKTLPKGGWVDFEHEISSIVQKLDELQDNNLRSRQKMQRISQLKVMPDILQRYNLYDNIPESLQNPDVSKRLLSDLDKLIRCLEIYLCCCLDLIDPSTHLKSITEIGAIDGVLSFNYTNTFEEIYEPKLLRKPEYCYIHGKARMENDIMLDNMVLGIDEYLDDVRKNEDIVLYNGMNPMEMGWVEQYSQIQAVLLCPGVGGSGFNSLGNILTGIVNPSGHTVDIWPYDLTKAPYFNNIGEFHYTNLDDYAADITAADVGVNPGGLFYFVNYVEGIYVGYKFYETAAEEGLIDYASSVKYPFGYGLSYTTFEQKMGDLAVDSAAGTITVTVTVTNTGNFAGKDVVQVYFNPPYTNGGIEKASANLIQFEKTALLEPGKSQDVTLTFQVDDMASFDDNGAGCYVLEAGDYEISIRNNSHDVIDQRTYTQSSTVTFNSESRSTDAVPALTAFDDAKGDVTYLSRADHFANYEAATAAPSDDQYVMSDDVRATYISNANYDAAADSDPNAVMPELGKKNNVKLADLRGLSYDDPKWDELLDMLSIEEMSGLITYGGWSTNAIPSIGKVATSDCDGPAGVNNFLKGKYGSSYCVETMLAQTWSKELAYAFGEGIGQELADLDNFGWYGPAMDTHRSAFGGRNFEYYSEDGVLGGYIAAAEVNGAQSKGVYAYLKHFAMNDQEIKCRSLLCTWSCEQAIREIYLKPFELAVKNYNGQGLAIMNGFNFIGTTWTGASRSLLTTVLRDEWGFRGFVCTDYFGGYGYMNAQRGIRAGTDLMLNMVSEFAAITDTSATSVQAMRQSTKNILYTVVNSGAYEPENLAEVTGVYFGYIAPPARRNSPGFSEI